MKTSSSLLLLLLLVHFGVHKPPIVWKSAASWMWNTRKGPTALLGGGAQMKKFEQWGMPRKGILGSMPLHSPALCASQQVIVTICSSMCSCQEVLPPNRPKGKAAKRPWTESSETITRSKTFFPISTLSQLFY